MSQKQFERNYKHSYHVLLGLATVVVIGFAAYLLITFRFGFWPVIIVSPIIYTVYSGYVASRTLDRNEINKEEMTSQQSERDYKRSYRILCRFVTSLVVGFIMYLYISYIF